MSDSTFSANAYEQAIEAYIEEKLAPFWRKAITEENRRRRDAARTRKRTLITGILVLCVCVIGVAAVLLWNYNQPINVYNRAIGRNPNDTEAYYKRGQLYNEKNEYDQAVADFTQVITLDPNHVAAYKSRGNTYKNKRDYEKAKEDYEAALRLDPNNAFAKDSLELTRKVSSLNDLGLVWIPGGTFTMGSPASEADRSGDEVQHQVTVNSFSMGKYEVTQKEYQELMGSNPSRFKGDNLPVECVSWYEAVEYCNARSRKEGLTPAYTVDGTNVSWNRSANGYRLPTEAEWEYACRAGTMTPYSSGSSVANAGWYVNNSGGETHPVGGKQANAWGLYDTHGNVSEWCWDWYGEYPSGAQTDPEGASSGSSRVRRGGDWGGSGQYLRSAYRFKYSPSYRNSYLGFRLVRP